MQDPVQEIKSRLAIEDLVTQYVQLKKVGRSFKGLCPFHAEKTPSFIVSPERGLAYCFGCHKGGDIFKFIQEIEGIDFVDALKSLAERTGVELKDYKVEKPVSKDEKSELLRIHDLVTSFYQKQLWDTEPGKKVLGYLHKRGLNDETIRLFRLGYAPDSYDITNTFLLGEGFTKKMVATSGLALAQETTFEKIYDRFRGRLMFPVTNTMGHVVAFGGRALAKDQEPKYLNSPETPIYHKGNILYAFSFSRSSIKGRQEALIVEGYMDALAAYQAGAKNVVASSGTALTTQQLRLLQPFAKTLLFAFDMDSAGQDASKRAYDLTLDFDFQVKVVQLPEGKDIADFTIEHAGILNDILQKAMPYGECFYDNLVKTYGVADIFSKRKILQEFYPFFIQLKSSVEKDFFVRKFANELGLTETQIYDEFSSNKLPKYHPARLHRSLENEKSPHVKKYRADELLLGFMIEFPRISFLFLDKVSENLFEEDLKPIYKAYIAHYNGQGPEMTVVDSGFVTLLDPEFAERAGLLSLYIAEYYGEIAESVVENEMKALIKNLQQTYFRKQTHSVQLKIMEAEKNGDKKMREQFLEQLKSLYL